MAERLRNDDPEGDWRAKGKCVEMDPEIFFSERADNIRMAKQACKACEVKDVCLDEAFRKDEQWGVWGGLTDAERRALKRRRRP